MWPNPQEIANLVTFAEKILNEKPFFLVPYSDQLFSFINKSKTNTRIVITIKSLKQCSQTLIVYLYAH